jgi:hypothetical protein
MLTYVRHYNIGYAIVSLVFITNAVGFILAAFFVDALRARFGRGEILSWLEHLTLYKLTYINSQNPHVCSDSIDWRICRNRLYAAISGCGHGIFLPRLRHGYKSGLGQCLRRQSPERHKNARNDAWLLRYWWHRWAHKYVYIQSDVTHDQY